MDGPFEPSGSLYTATIRKESKPARPRAKSRVLFHESSGSPAMKNGRCRMHGGTSPGAPKGNKRALKHGRYTAEAIARRYEIRELLRAMNALSNTGERM
jgi:hypothetical protein